MKVKIQIAKSKYKLYFNLLYFCCETFPAGHEKYFQGFFGACLLVIECHILSERKDKGLLVSTNAMFITRCTNKSYCHTVKSRFKP